MGRVAPRMVRYPNYRNRYHNRRIRRGVNNIGLPLFYRRPRNLPNLSWYGGGLQDGRRRRSTGGLPARRKNGRNVKWVKNVPHYADHWGLQAMALLHTLINRFQSR